MTHDADRLFDDIQDEIIVQTQRLLWKWLVYSACYEFYSFDTKNRNTDEIHIMDRI